MLSGEHFVKCSEHRISYPTGAKCPACVKKALDLEQLAILIKEAELTGQLREVRTFWRTALAAVVIGTGLWLVSR